VRMMVAILSIVAVFEVMLDATSRSWGWLGFWGAVLLMNGWLTHVAWITNRKR
jgi:hypothetical protein